MNPRSLRAILLSSELFTLDERLALAQKLTSSILFLHTVSFVHKNIRPETIIVFEDVNSKIGSPFLAGFEKFRLEAGTTYRTGDDTWNHNLCDSLFPLPEIIPHAKIGLDRHPTRQGTNPELKYRMQHDIYSLGVILLEIGLWTSFVLYPPSPAPSSLIRTPNLILSPQNLERRDNPLNRSTENKEKLQELAQSKLPILLGKRYTDIVLQCLKCLDPVSTGNQDEMGQASGAADWRDEDGIVIGVRYIENVLVKMQEITV